MVYIRGSRHDYDEWAKEGCDGWSYKDVLPYFIKAEDFQMDEYADSGKYCMYNIRKKLIIDYKLGISKLSFHDFIVIDKHFL